MSSEGASIKSYRDLFVWQKAMVLAEQVCAITAGLPPEERYGLTSQLHRAVVSIPSNLAENHARESTREFARFIATARGSLAELETRTELLSRPDMAQVAQLKPVSSCCDELGRMLRGLKKSLDNKLAVASH